MLVKSAQMDGSGLDLHSNPVLCPECGTKTMVYRSRQNRRNRKCPHCHHRYVTQEVHQSEIDRLLGMVDSALELVNGGSDE